MVDELIMHGNWLIVLYSCFVTTYIVLTITNIFIHKDNRKCRVSAENDRNLISKNHEGAH